MGKPLENAQRLLDSLLEILKGYWKAAGKCPSTCHQQKERMQNCPAAISKNLEILFIISEALHFSLYIFMKIRRRIKKFINLSAAPLLIIFYHVIPLLAKLTLVQGIYCTAGGDSSTINAYILNYF